MISAPRTLNPKAAEAVRFLVDVLDGYFQTEYYGLENIPLGEKFVWTHNHSGWPSLDGLVIAKKISEENERHNGTSECGLGFWHDMVASAPLLKNVIENMGCLSIKEIDQYPFWDEHNIFITPAEGEEGNFKSSFSSLYKLAPFKTGIGRIACKGNVKYLLPVSIYGPEESFPVMTSIKIPISKISKASFKSKPMELFRKNFARVFKGDLTIPVLFPIQAIPIKWKVQFHPPINISRLVKNQQKDEFDKATYKKISAKAEKVIAADIESESQKRENFHVIMPKVSKEAVSKIISLMAS